MISAGKWRMFVTRMQGRQRTVVERVCRMKQKVFGRADQEADK